MAPHRLRLPGALQVRPTESYRRKLVAAALLRLAIGALALLALCVSLA